MVETDAPPSYDDAEEFAAQTVEVEYAEPEVYEPVEPAGRPAEIEPESEGNDAEAEEPKPLWRRLSSLIIPIAVVIYIAISAFVNNDAG
jgi:hypothetical protein